MSLPTTAKAPSSAHQIIPSLQMNEDELISVLQSSVYPGAAIGSIKLVVNACRASGKDPLKKPFHIVPMSVKTGRKKPNGYDETEMRDVIMPGINDYRTDASRTGQHAGTSEPEFGPDVSEKLGNVSITYPAWCRVTVKRLMPTGQIVEFSAVERWKENYATAGRDNDAPNAMWKKRPYAQLAKCAEAQALRKGFPEVGNQPTADEMEGKEIDMGAAEIVGSPQAEPPPAASVQRKSTRQPEQAPAAGSVIDNETGEILQPDSPPAEEAAPAQRRESAPPRQEAHQGNGSSASEGLLNVVRNKLKSAGLNEQAALDAFQIDQLAGISTQLANQIIKWSQENATA